MKEKKRARLGRINNAGYFFTLPFLIGLVLIFLPAVGESIVYMFSDVRVELGHVDIKFAGIENFRQAFLVDTEFRGLLLDGLRAMLFDTVQIMIFSFFIANILTQSFVGRSLARTMFFLPVILSTGIVAGVSAWSERFNPAAIYGSVSGEFGSPSGSLIDLQAFLLSVIPNVGISGIIGRAVGNTFNVINLSGVQILIFLTALHSINPSIFEASKTEGASKWEEFWKITFPLITPMLFVNVVYTIIDSFTNPAYGMMDYIRTQAFSLGKMGFASALSWIYFLITLAVLGLCSFVFTRYTVYLDT